MKSSKRKRVRQFFKKQWITIVISAFIGAFASKCIDLLIPSELKVESLKADTVFVEHNYVFGGNEDDSITKKDIETKLENLQLLNEYESEVKKKIKILDQTNHIMTHDPFTNYQGYIVQSPNAYGIITVNPTEFGYIEVSLDFFQEDFYKEVLCIQARIRTHKAIIESHNYVPQDYNIIRLGDDLPNGDYYIEIGFYLKKDYQEPYPTFYKTDKSLIIK